jgi:murein tripeptide amidase MpaA
LTDIRFDEYYRYEAITAFLQAWAEAHSKLCRLDSLGQSFEGREIWLLTVTNFGTGPDNEKPAYWVDANIHATEVAPSSAALYLIRKLLDEYGREQRITHVLDTRAFYIVPRLNPDGAEWALADKPKYIRSSTRPYPRTDELDGLYQEDVDEDGRILQMRLPDPQGAWKPHPEESRLMIRREPEDLPGGAYYRLLPEGRIRNYDGAIIELAPPLQGLDLNRNFPVNWLPNERGAGPFPTSEPEIRAAVQFIVDHENITGGLTFHTFSGVHLRPLSSGPDEDMPTQDLRVFKRLGEKGEQLTGYPAASVYHEFKYDPKDYIKGAFDDWMYAHRGLYAWTTEIWSPQRQAGVEVKKYIEWFKEHPVEDDLKILRWADETLPGEGYVDWYAVEHPELGQVELGGWQTMITWRNPPPHLLEKEIAPLADFVILNCLVSPRLEIRSLATERHGDVYTIRLVLHNTGWLPTNISQQALDMKAVRELEVDIELPDGAKLISGKKKTWLGQLGGRDAVDALSVWGANPTDERAKVEWVVEAPMGGTVNLKAVHQRAGTVYAEVLLD